ncbi:hypothetical protein LLH23_18640 [bacterium]|nr:hypothetical protein [bacterium]
MVSPKYWLGCLLCGVSFAAGHEAVITVNPAQIVGKVNPLILGNNQLAYPGRPEYAKHGSGLWDPDKRAPVPEYVALSREAGITIQRWPGGCIAHNYNWKKTVGPLSERPDMLWGLPEFMTFCEASGSIPLITLAVYWGDQNDAADIVEYLNSPVGKNPNGGKDWAAVRAADGHPQPYGVVYFEYGNEDYHGEHKTADNPNPRKITPEDYAKQYLAYQKAMKAVDSKIRLAGLLQYGLWDWNKAVLVGCGKQMDYAIDHTYTPGFSGDTDEEKGHKYMLACLAADAHIQDVYDRLHAQIKEVCGRTNMQLAITEYNGWFVQEKPVPYRQAFGNALRNAEHLRVMMRPQNRILMGNFWQFANEYWGMVKGYVHKGETPVKQANFFPYQMYHERFGDTLIGVQVQCGNWDFMGGPLPARKGKPTEFKLFEENLLPKDYTWEERGPEAGITQTFEGQVVHATFSGNDPNYYAPKLNVPADPDTGYRVTGLVRTDGIDNTRGVGFQVGDARGWTETKSCSLGGSVTGTSDWTQVEVEYTTLPETTAIEIIARRLGGGGNISGQAWFKLVSVQKFIPKNAGAVPDLGVNAAKRADGTVTLMIVNKNPEQAVPATIRVGAAGRVGARVPTRAGAWILTAPSLEANNLKDPNTVKITPLEVLKTAEGLQVTLPPFSMAAVEIEP